MIIITHIYAPNERTQQTIDSFTRFGYEVAVDRADTHRGNGEVLRRLLEVYKRAATGHELFIYADAADSFCQRPISATEEAYLGQKLIYSTEKACYPHTWVADKYPAYVRNHISPWKYLNGGGYAGPLKLMIEFMERYGLGIHPGDINGQHEQMLAYIQAGKDGFPIELDIECKLFQTMAFADPSEFLVKMHPVGDVNYEGSLAGNLVGKQDEAKVLYNKVTQTVPSILHFNGLTPMTILKELK